MTLSNKRYRGWILLDNTKREKREDASI